MNRATPLHPSLFVVTLAAAALLSPGAPLARAAVPFSEATVTRLQNKVSYGEQRGVESVTRPASVEDVVRARNFLLTETDARAELKYPDGSIVRVGQNTVFTFEADTRTLQLNKGSLIFYIPKGQGGGVIKTPSLTAAITGTVGKVSRNTIAVIEGSLKLVPSGKVVKAGQFVRRNPNGTLTIDFFDPATVMDGALMTFNGPLPPFAEEELVAAPVPQLDLSDLTVQETLDRTANHPSANRNFFPVRQEKEPKEKEKVPLATPAPTPRPATPRPTTPRQTTPQPRGAIDTIFNPSTP